MPLSVFVFVVVIGLVWFGQGWLGLVWFGLGRFCLVWFSIVILSWVVWFLLLDVVCVFVVCWCCVILFSMRVVVSVFVSFVFI